MIDSQVIILDEMILKNVRVDRKRKTGVSHPSSDGVGCRQLCIFYDYQYVN